MELANFNNEIVKCRKPINNATVFTIRRITKKIESLKKKKGSEQQLAKNSRRCDRLVQELYVLKSVKANDVVLFALENDGLIEEKVKQVGLSLEDKALLSMAQCQITKKTIESLKERVPEWKKLVIQFKARAERRKKWRERQKVIEKLDEEFDKCINKEKQKDENQDEEEETDEDKSDKDEDEEGAEESDVKADTVESEENEESGVEAETDEDEERSEDADLKADTDEDEEEAGLKADTNEEESEEADGNEDEDDESSDDYDDDDDDDDVSSSDGENHDDEEDQEDDDKKHVEPLNIPAIRSVPKKNLTVPMKVEKTIIKNLKPSLASSKIVSHKGGEKPSQPQKKLPNLPEKDSEMSVRQLDLSSFSVPNLDESITIDSLSKDDPSDRRMVTKESPQVRKKRDRFFLGGSGSEDDSEEEPPQDFDDPWGSEAPRFPYRQDRGRFSRPFPSRGSYRGHHDREFRGRSFEERGNYRGHNDREFRGRSFEERDAKRHAPEPPRSREPEKKLHPSWEAKKKLKLRDPTESAPRGKKTTFDD